MDESLTNGQKLATRRWRLACYRTLVNSTVMADDNATLQEL
jgi:hypothetical protein